MERDYSLPPSALAETHEVEPVDSHPDEQRSDDEGVANQQGGQGLKEKNTCNTPRKKFERTFFCTKCGNFIYIITLLITPWPSVHGMHGSSHDSLYLMCYT